MRLDLERVFFSFWEIKSLEWLETALSQLIRQ